MAVSLAPTGQSGRKSLDSELNLVPFIDLLICCICFLLITAVWTQLASVPTSLRAPGTAGDGRVPPTARLTVLVGGDGYTVSLGPERVLIPRKGSFYDDEGLGKTLRRVRAEVGQPDLTVAAEDGIAYQYLVRAMDVVRAERFEDIKVSDGAGLL